MGEPKLGKSRLIFLMSTLFDHPHLRSKITSLDVVSDGFAHRSRMSNTLSREPTDVTIEIRPTVVEYMHQCLYLPSISLVLACQTATSIRNRLEMEVKWGVESVPAFIVMTKLPKLEEVTFRDTYNGRFSGEMVRSFHPVLRQSIANLPFLSTIKRIEIPACMFELLSLRFQCLETLSVTGLIDFERDSAFQRLDFRTPQPTLKNLNMHYIIVPLQRFPTAGFSTAIRKLLSHLALDPHTNINEIKTRLSTVHLHIDFLEEIMEPQVHASVVGLLRNSGGHFEKIHNRIETLAYRVTQPHPPPVNLRPYLLGARYVNLVSLTVPYWPPAEFHHNLQILTIEFPSPIIIHWFNALLFRNSLPQLKQINLHCQWDRLLFFKHNDSTVWRQLALASIRVDIYKMIGGYGKDQIWHHVLWKDGSPPTPDRVLFLRALAADKEFVSANRALFLRALVDGKEFTPSKK